jgi:O-antigen ligase
VEVGSTRIDTSGRLEIWAAVIASAREDPVTGKGLGSSQVLLGAADPGASPEHPHNDYLRLWHDLGLVGLLLFLTAAGGWMVILLRSWYQAEQLGRGTAQLKLAAALGLLAVLLAMITDNVIVYVFVMGPLGVIVGAGLGLAK